MVYLICSMWCVCIGMFMSIPCSSAPSSALRALLACSKSFWMVLHLAFSLLFCHCRSLVFLLCSSFKASSSSNKENQHNNNQYYTNFITPYKRVHACQEVGQWHVIQYLHLIPFLYNTSRVVNSLVTGRHLAIKRLLYKDLKFYCLCIKDSVQSTMKCCT